mmetsp:Transcript_39310/g.91890  ORF Transcript_39310/g.91890 Transcript_39310/m.91890 type:complete len:304 (-) Transcript_39310:574-1485(-)
MLPSTLPYPALPVSTLRSEDLPDPEGPIIAVSLPAATLPFTPTSTCFHAFLHIRLSMSVPGTGTWRLRFSKVMDTWVFLKVSPMKRNESVSSSSSSHDALAAFSLRAFTNASANLPLFWTAPHPAVGAWARTGTGLSSPKLLPPTVTGRRASDCTGKGSKVEPNARPVSVMDQFPRGDDLRGGGLGASLAFTWSIEAKGPRMLIVCGEVGLCGEECASPFIWLSMLAIGECAKPIVWLSLLLLLCIATAAAMLASLGLLLLGGVLAAPGFKEAVGELGELLPSILKEALEPLGVLLDLADMVR